MRDIVGRKGAWKGCWGLDPETVIMCDLELSQICFCFYFALVLKQRTDVVCNAVIYGRANDLGAGIVRCRQDVP
jgi:hypothetical protein